MQTLSEPADTLEIVFAPYGYDPAGVPNKPLPTQQRVLDWVDRVRAGEKMAPGVPVLYIQHGVNSGGTRSVMAPMCEMLMECPGIRVLDGRKDFNDLRLSAMETFFDIVPSQLICDKDEQEHRYCILSQPEGQGTLFFRELKDTGGLGSQEFAVIVVHEAHEIDLRAYRTLKQRCRQKGYPNMILMEGNPPSLGHWLEAVKNPQSTDWDPDLTVLELTSYENWDNMAESYRSSLESMPESWRRRYLLGQTGALPSGTPVYPSFVESVHVRPTQLIPDRPIIRGWDFGYRRAACVWGQRADNGRMVWHREWMAMETPEEQFIAGVKVRTAEWFGGTVCMDIGDPAAVNRDPAGVSTMDRLKKAGIFLRSRRSTYAERIPLINRKLSELIAGEASVIINPMCQILIEGLAGGYHYPEIQPDKEFTSKKEVPFKDGYFEHVLNAWEYPFVNLFMTSSTGIQRAITKNKQARVRMAHRRGPAGF